MKQLSPAALRRVAAEVAPRFAGRRKSMLEIRESFPIWTLARQAPAHPRSRLDRYCVDLGRWHHQVHESGRARYAAQSTRKGRTQKLRSLSRGLLASQIAEAIAWIDAHVQDDVAVRLLLLPWCRAEALWLDDGAADRVVIVTVPTRLKGRLAKHTIYDGSSFLRAVARLPKPPAPRKKSTRARASTTT